MAGIKGMENGFNKPKKENLAETQEESQQKRIVSTVERPRLSVFRSARHIYGQIVDDTTGRTIAAACSNEKSVNDQPTFESKVAKAVFTGKLLAQRAMDKGVKKVVFDRNGFSVSWTHQSLIRRSPGSGFGFLAHTS
jgi:large subunit ribosomal protein L18